MHWCTELFTTRQGIFVVQRFLPILKRKRPDDLINNKNNHCFSVLYKLFIKNKLNSVARVRERTLPSERPPFVGGVSANVCGERVPCGQRDGSLRPYSRISRPEPLLFLPSCSSRGWVDHVPDALIPRKSGSAGNRTRTSEPVARNSHH
jgi:hypothetical protein